jgi:hypothetical protein
MLVIKEATYGTGPTYVNVTKHLQSLIKNDSIDVIVSPKTMGSDPSVGTTKSLSVTYVVDGVQEQKTVEDGSTFSVYTTAQKAAEVGPRKVVGSATTSVFNTILSGLSTFLHILGVGIAYKVGTTIFDPIIGYVLTGVALIIPYFGLWGVPIIVFVYRMLSSGDLAGLATVPSRAVADMSTIVST